jgi:hypothetical protein
MLGVVVDETPAVDQFQVSSMEKEIAKKSKTTRTSSMLGME